MDQQLLDLVIHLTAKTFRNEAVWNATNADDQFALKTGSGTIIVDLYGQGAAYSLSVVTKSGMKVREIMAQEGEPGFAELKELYETTVRRYHRIDETFDEVIREVQKPGRIGDDDDMPF